MKTQKKVFTRNGALFSPNSAEDQKKRSLQKMEQFFTPNSGKDQKKRSFPKVEHFFPNSIVPLDNYAQMHTRVKLLGGDADVDHTQTIGADSVKLLGRIYPQSPLPGFGTPGSGNTKFGMRTGVH